MYMKLLNIPLGLIINRTRRCQKRVLCACSSRRKSALNPSSLCLLLSRSFRMKISLNWLKDYVQLDASVDENHRRSPFSGSRSSR